MQSRKRRLLVQVSFSSFLSTTGRLAHSPIRAGRNYPVKEIQSATAEQPLNQIEEKPAIGPIES
jgi:hypothetical protein